MAFFRRLIVPTLGLICAAALILQARPAADPDGQTPAASAFPPTAPGIVAEARVTTYPGAQVVVGSELAGMVLKLSVQEKDRVVQGQAVAELRSLDTRAAIEAAEARQREAEADIRFQELEVQRAEKLWQDKMGPRQGLDRAMHDLAAARARRDAAAAEGRRLQAILDKMRILAPIAGTVLERHAHPGEILEEGAPVVTIADLARCRVEAEVDEYDIGRIRLGMPVAITAEGYEGRSWQGRVEEIPDRVVSRRIKPQDPARPTDVRVLLVKIALLEATPLKLDQRVEVRIHGEGSGSTSDR